MTWRLILGGGLGRRTRHRGLRLVARLKRPFRTFWSDAREVFKLIRYNGKAWFCLSILLTGSQWLARYSIVSAIVAFLGLPAQPVLFWVLQWVVFTLSALIPTPGGAGGAEAAFFVLYSPFIPSSAMGLVTAGWRFFSFYLLLGLAAILYMILGPGKSVTPPAGKA